MDFLIAKQILLVSTLRNVFGNSMEIIHTDIRV